jgi:uncharacterized protein (TIRG00374 family)
MKRGKIVSAVMIDAVSWFISIIQYYVITLALGIDIEFVILFAIVPVVILLGALPVSISGLGTRDAALIFFFSLSGLSSELAVSLSILIFMTVHIVMGLAGSLLWLRNPMKYNAGKSLRIL